MTPEQFIRDYDEWPRWPMLPVVGRRGKVEAGIVIAGHPTTVYIANMFALKGNTLGEVLADKKKVEYETPELLLKEWRID